MKLRPTPSYPVPSALGGGDFFVRRRREQHGIEDLAVGKEEETSAYDG